MSGLQTALRSLHVAAEAIGRVPGVTGCIAESDHNSGEIIFDTADGRVWILRLREEDDDEEEEDE